MGKPAREFSTTTWRTVFGIDSRSLAVFRMAIAVLLLVDLAVRATDLRAMYTDDGMFSRAEICLRATSLWNWSFHFGGGSWGYQAVLFGIAAGLACALLAGFETRLATIGSWLMIGVELFQLCLQRADHLRDWQKIGRSLLPIQPPLEQVTDARHLSQARLPPGVLPAPEAGGQEQEQTHGGRGDFDDLKASSPGKLFVFGLTRNRRHGGHGESLRGRVSRSKPRFSVRRGANSSKQKFAL